jgi:hypothetical protein
MGWELSSSLIEIHDSLGELNKTSLRSITFAMSKSVEHVLFGNLQSGLHLLVVSLGEISVLKGSNGDLLNSGVELLGLIIRWVVVENSICSQNDGLNKGKECWVFWVVLSNILIFWLLFQSVSLMLLVVDGAIKSLSVKVHMGNRHSVLSQSSGFVRADAGGGTEGLDGLKVLDQDHFTGHSLGGQSKGDCDSGKKTLWHVGDDDTNSKHQVGDDIVLIDDTADEESNSERHGDSRDDLDESLDLNGKWSLTFLGR